MMYWGTKVHGGLWVMEEQASEAIDPEIHSLRVWGPQSPDPPALSNFCIDMGHGFVGLTATDMTLCTRGLKNLLWLNSSTARDIHRWTWSSWWSTNYETMTHVYIKFEIAGRSGLQGPRALWEWTSGSIVCEACLYHSKTSLDSCAL